MQQKSLDLLQIKALLRIEGLEPSRVLSSADFESAASAIPPHPLSDEDYFNTRIYGFQEQIEKLT